ncbi:hypothetical protein VOLCADRAFT_88113 [Volvox carteri f. nagariensis]|uniref:DUF6570 domain-containing protein n=1 Tax=Volvox carteri f. nagariensis TaxID=3068 RepID=D8TNB3_VOLCA|nr:uncharacterized protein VOLCADRAFT_88113 [Volvox carteri f. nagariensis]EFJ50814.1 hypothetical protein VOLCADRAFT_88113 [Volvox carteri f. nagariensis]|eukprot:XP_002947826.1 hypothetical protein VOLCADRAFT_88113 [Volvox carteri f. nagariensis]
MGVMNSGATKVQQQVSAQMAMAAPEAAVIAGKTIMEPGGCEPEGDSLEDLIGERLDDVIAEYGDTMAMGGTGGGAYGMPDHETTAITAHQMRAELAAVKQAARAARLSLLRAPLTALLCLLVEAVVTALLPVVLMLPPRLGGGFQLKMKERRPDSRSWRLGGTQHLLLPRWLAVLVFGVLVVSIVANVMVRVQQQLRDAAQHAASRADPEVRALQQQRNTAQHAAARADPEVRALQQQRNTAQHAAARADPEVRALQQQRNTAQHAAAHADPEVRALQQQRNTARHAAARQVQLRNQQAAPRDTLLARMHRLLRFTDLHRDAAIDLPDFLLAIPEGRVQDLPGGQLPPDRQVPYTVQLQCASTMAVALRRRMPSRVCAVCSEVCSEDQSTVLPWMEIPNVDILRADVMCTDAVQRWGRTLVWRRMARTAQGEAPPPPDPVLPARYRVSRAERVAAVDDDGAGRLVDDAAEGALEMGGDAPETGDLEAAAAEQEPPEQLPPDQQPHPPRVLPRACLDDPASVEVPYCMRLEPDLPNCTMLVGDGVAERIFICNACHKALSARRVPEAALARLDPGDVPHVNHLGDPLPSPTFLEGQLLGRGRIIQQLLIMYLADRPPDVFPRAVKTHGIGVVNPDPNMLRGQLPARASDLAGAITVVCVDQVHSRAELLERVRKVPGLQVRGQVIVAWVRFLQHNDEEELAIDEDALQEYERMGCVRQFQDVVEAAVRDGNLADAAAAPDVDPAGPVQPTLADPTPNAGHDPGPGPFTAILRGPADQPVEGAPVDPTAATLDELELILPQPSNVGDDGSEIDRFPGRVEDLLTGRARLAFAAGGRDSHVLDDRHPAILTLCFPQSFPMAQVGITMNMRPHLGEPAACVPRDVIRAMGTILALPYRHSQRRQLLAQQSPLVKALVEGARLSTLRLDLTDAYYNGARSKMRAAALTIGWPPLFFTVNPADMHAACAVVASGQVLDFDDDGRPQHIPSTVEKWRRVKDDPYSCAALLVATKEVLVEELFGFAPGAMQQTNPRCFCGLTFEVAVKVEQSGCLALHIHGVAHVATFAVERLQALFSGPNCRALALAYALCAMWYPSPYYDPFTRGAEHYIMDMTVEEAQQHGRAPPPVDKSCPPAAYDFGRLAGCAAVICSTLTHTHNDTCKRHGCRGTDDSCGMAFPRVLRSAFQWIGTGGLFLLPRLGLNIVPHMPAAALAFGCNQLFTLACEVDRVYTAEAAAQLARPEDERGDCVLLQPAADRARDSAYYSTKYTGKSINDSQAQLTCNALTRVQDFLLAGRTPNPGASGPTAFGNMCATVHRMTAAITAGMALVAMKLDGHSTFEATFECAYLQVDAFTALSAGADQSPEVATTAAVLVEAEEQEGYTVTNAVHNYVLRGEELSGLDCSVYNLSSNYEVRRVPPAQHPHRERLGLQSPVAVRRRKRTTPATPITAPVPAPVPLLTAAPAPPPEPPAPTAAATLDQPTSQTATELPRLVAFHGTHPLYRTHVHIRLPRPRYVQLGGSLPRRPRPGTSAAGMAQYYAFVLGTFKAHRGQPIPPGLSVKEAYDTWWAELGTTEAGRSYQAYVTVLLDNIEEDHAGKARRQAEYNQRRRQQRAAAAAAALPEGDSTSASDGDTDDGIHGHLRPDPETQLPAEDQLEHFVYIPGQEYPTAGTDLAAVALTDLFDCTNAAGVYAYDAARRCRAPALADGHGAGSDRFSRRITPADLPLLTEAAKRLKRYLVAAAAGTVEADGGAHAGLTATPEMDTPHVELHRPTSRPLVAIVRMPGTPERTEQARMPLYVHLPQPPSIDDTIELFTLAPHQAVPFMLMARYFDRRDEPNPGDPPQMLVEGKPGTGKSQFVQALLWYTFQHGCPHWAATCTYSWAAATAFSTPVHRSLSTHAMFALSAGSNRADSVRKGSAASLQVHRNVGDGALIIDEIGMNSLDHLGACNQSCTRHLLPPPHLAGDHPAATIFSGRPSANTGDEFQHPKPGGPPLYRYAAAVECNPQFSPSVPTAQPLHGEEANDGDPNEAAAGSQGGQQQPEAAARRPRAVPQTQSCILEGFRVYRSLAKTVFLLEKQQRQDSSPSGRRLTEYASMFGGEPATEQRIAEMVDDLNSRAIVDLADLAHLEPRVVLQRNEPRHTLNTRLIMLEAQRKNQRLVVWNADHVPVQKRGAAVEPALTHVEKAVAMRIKDHEFGHTTADTWYYHGARYILLDTTAADAGASHNNEVEACGLLEDGREPADDGRGPYRRLKYLPAAVIVRPISGHIPGTVLQGLGDYASRGGAFILSPRASCIAEVEMPAAGYGTITKQIRRLNVPLGDRQAVTDYFVQGRSFKDECWLVDLAVPPNSIKRATLYVLLTRFKTLDHVRLLRPLYTTPHERKRIIKQFLSATNLEPDLAANLRLLKQAAREMEQRYTAEFEHARQLEARWTRPVQD